MARIFYGRRDMLNSAVLEAVRTLGDDFWVLAEFDLDRRNIDWLIIRAVPDHRPKGFFSTLYMTELKNTSAQLSGGESGPWAVERNGTAKVIVPNNKADENYWHQASNVSETVRRWLHNNQRRFLSLELPEQTEASIQVWPTLLILSDPPEMVHRLPLAPANRFGSIHRDLATWLATVQQWNFKRGLQLTTEELERLVEVIGLHELSPPSVSVSQNVAQQSTAGDLSWFQDFALWIKGIEERLTHLEERRASVEAAVQATSGLEERLRRVEVLLASIEASKAAATVTKSSKASVAAAVKTTVPSKKTTKVSTKPGNGAVGRALTEAEKQCIIAALTALRLANRSRTMSSLFTEMNKVAGGETFRKRKYNGFGTAKAMLDRAVQEKLICYGPLDANRIPTVYLPQEAIPKT